MTLVGTMGAQVRHLFVGRSIFFQSTYFFLGKWARDLLAWIVSDVDSRKVFFDHIFIEAPLMALYVTVIGVAARLLFPREFGSK